VDKNTIGKIGRLLKLNQVVSQSLLMQPITDTEHGKVQYNFDSDMGKPNVYGITSTLRITSTLTNSLTPTTTLL